MLYISVGFPNFDLETQIKCDGDSSNLKKGHIIFEPTNFSMRPKTGFLQI